MDIKGRHENTHPCHGSRQETCIREVFFHGHHAPIGRGNDVPLVLRGMSLRVTEKVSDKERKEKKEEAELREAEQITDKGDDAEPNDTGITLASEVHC
jgi:hypothetical protein